MAGGNIVLLGQTSFPGVVRANIFSTYVAIFCAICILEKVRRRDVHWKSCLLFYGIYQLAGAGCFLILNESGCNIPDVWQLFLRQLSCNIFYTEGNIFIIVFGVVLYYSKEDKAKLVRNSICCILLNSMMIIGQIPARILLRVNLVNSTLADILAVFVYYILGYEFRYYETVDIWYEGWQWMMVFALPFIMAYNGTRGKYYKYFYYVIYPVHLILLMWIKFYFFH